MAFENYSRPPIDVLKPNVARMHDYYMGGHNNYPADREAAAKVVQAAPDVILALGETRAFVRRALQFLTHERKVRQFLVIGPGLPAQSMPHELIEKFNPYACVCYVDYDPFVLAQLRAMLVGAEPYTAVVDGDLRQPDSIFLNRQLNQLIDFKTPVALILTHILEFISGDDLASSAIQTCREHLVSGSYLVAAHGTSDDKDDQILRSIRSAYSDATEIITMRSYNQIEALLRRFELLRPGIVHPHLWRPDDPPHSPRSYSSATSAGWVYAAVGRRT